MIEAERDLVHLAAQHHRCPPGHEPEPERFGWLDVWETVKVLACLAALAAILLTLGLWA